MNLQENIQRIKQVMRINESFEKNIKETASESGDKLYILQDTNKLHEGRVGCLPKFLDIYFNFLLNKTRKIKHHYLSSSESGFFFKYGTKQDEDTHKKVTGTFMKYQLIRSHTCRRSFATNHYNKLPNKLIMAVTGHSTEKMLLNYIGETENTHLDDFMSIWEEEHNKKQIEKLKILPLQKNN